MLNALRTASRQMRGSCTRVFHLVIGAQHVDGVDELVRLLVHAAIPIWPGERDQRGVVEVGVGDARGQVGGPGPEGREAHARASGEAAVGVGHEGGALLVAHGDEA